MDRRAFISLVSTSIIVAPLAAGAQQAGKISRVGILSPAGAVEYAAAVEAFRHGLRDHGYVEGKNLSIEYRWAAGS